MEGNEVTINREEHTLSITCQCGETVVLPIGGTVSAIECPCGFRHSWDPVRMRLLHVAPSKPVFGGITIKLEPSQ